MEGVFFVSLFLSMILFVGNSCVNSGFGSACDLRREKECCFSVFCFVFFVFFRFPLVTQFSWPVECGHGIEHVICVQVSLGFFLFFFGFLFVCFLFVWFFVRGTLLVCFLRFLFRFLLFLFLFCGCRRLLLPAFVCVFL